MRPAPFTAGDGGGPGTPRREVMPLPDGPPRLAYVLKMFPRTSETFILNEILELERQGRSLVIYSLKAPLPGPRHAALSRVKAEVVYLPHSPWRALLPVLAAHAVLLARNPPGYLRNAWYIATRKNAWAVKRFLQAGVLALDAEKRGLGHLHAHFATSATRVAMLASRLSPRLGYSFTAHAKDIYLDSQDVDLLRDKIEEARFVVTVSDFNRRHLEKLCGPVTTRKVFRLYNGVDLDLFTSPTRPRSGRRILCVARLVEKKGVADLLRACARLRERNIAFQCRIVGDGPLRRPLEQLAGDLGLEELVSFLGAEPHEEVARELRAASVLALPCVIAADGNRDGLPTVLLEAMASGTPVVSTRVTGIPEMIEDGLTGRLVEPGHPEELASALEQVLDEPELGVRMGCAGRRQVEERFNLRTNVAVLHERFRQVLKPEPETRPAGIRRLWPHFAPHVREERASLLLALAAALALAATEVLAPWPLKLVFDYALGLHPHAARIPFLKPLAGWPANRLLLVASALLIAIAGLRALSGYAQTWYLTRAGQRIITSLRERTFNHLQRLSLAFHRVSRAGDLLVRLTGDINVLSDVLVTAAVEASGRLLQLAGMIVVMVWMDLPLTVAALSVLPFMVLLIARYTRQIREAARAQRKREGAIAARAGEAIAQIAVVKAFTREEHEERSFAVETRAVLSAGLRAGRVEAAMQRGVEMFVAVGTGIVLWLGAHRVFAGTLSPGDLLVFTAYLRQMYRPIREVAGLVNRLSKAQACAERVADILESEPETRERPGAVAAPALRGEVAFEAVGFAYRPGAWALRHLSFTIVAGERLAIIGHTGSGKSTLAGLLPRFHDPSEGRVLLDGKDIRDFTLPSLRRQVSLVLQEPMLFGGTIRENIAYGRPEASEEEIAAAARAACIHEFIISLPEGYETRIAERGATLSGGQKQRIAVARAILRDAPLLILDEPTSGLDPESEAAVHKALEHLMRGRTTLLITHRMALAATADRILVLERGLNVGLGTHAELIENCGVYRGLVQHELESHESLAV